MISKYKCSNCGFICTIDEMKSEYVEEDKDWNKYLCPVCMNYVENLDEWEKV